MCFMSALRDERWLPKRSVSPPLYHSEASSWATVSTSSFCQAENFAYVHSVKTRSTFFHPQCRGISRSGSPRATVPVLQV
jgi:hypothetical protein